MPKTKPRKKRKYAVLKPEDIYDLEMAKWMKSALSKRHRIYSITPNK